MAGIDGAEPDRRHVDDEPNHHLTKPVFIGEIQADGQFNVVWKTKGLVPGDAWSDTCRARRTSTPIGSRSSAATTTP